MDLPSPSRMANRTLRAHWNHGRADPQGESIFIHPYSPVGFPVPVERIADAMGIQYMCVPGLEGNYGVVIHEYHAYKALLNNEYGRRRRIFTLAQIMGLSLIPGNDSKNEGFVIPPSVHIDNPKRQWAFDYAMMLTMPADAIRHCWADGWSVGRMTDTFDVPRSIVHQRIGGLGLH